jgi:hypothetical protein
MPPRRRSTGQHCCANEVCSDTKGPVISPQTTSVQDCWSVKRSSGVGQFSGHGGRGGHVYMQLTPPLLPHATAAAAQLLCTTRARWPNQAMAIPNKCVRHPRHHHYHHSHYTLAQQAIESQHKARCVTGTHAANSPQCQCFRCRHEWRMGRRAHMLPLPVAQSRGGGGVKATSRHVRHDHSGIAHQEKAPAMGKRAFTERNPTSGKPTGPDICKQLNCYRQASMPCTHHDVNVSNVGLDTLRNLADCELASTCIALVGGNLQRKHRHTEQR